MSDSSDDLQFFEQTYVKKTRAPAAPPTSTPLPNKNTTTTTPTKKNSNSTRTKTVATPTRKKKQQQQQQQQQQKHSKHLERKEYSNKTQHHPECRHKRLNLNPR